MPIARRTLLTGAASAALIPASQAATPFQSEQAPGYYRFKLGDYEVTMLNDGERTSPLPASFVANVPYGQVQAAAAEAFMPPGKMTTPYNPALINTGAKLVLLDAGNGPAPNGSATTVGRLFTNLAAAGVQPADIDIVVISHLHPDHINGLRAADGTIAFPNAKIVAPQNEMTFWMDDANAARATTVLDKFLFANVRKTFAGFEDRIGRYDWGNEVAPGITAVATPGHTPGHTSFVVASGNSTLLVQADVTNIPELFLRNPDWHCVFDQDPDMAQATRHKVYDMAANEHMPVAGYHFAFPSLGHVERAGAGYRLVPVPWSSVI